MTLLSHTKKILLATVMLGMSSYTFADANSDVIEAIIQILDIVFAMISALMTPAVILAGWLLSPDWTMGDFFGLRKYFIQVWVLVSNIVYIIFAMILLFLAVMQIFGNENSEYTFKQKLPKFLLGLLMVPFTWLIVSWTISFASQATAAVLAIPMGAIVNLQDSDEQLTDENGKIDRGMFHEKVIPTKISLGFNSGNTGAAPEQVDCTSLTSSSDNTCISAAEFIAHNDAGPYFIMMVYAYDIFKVQKTALVKLSDACTTDTDAGKCIKNLTDVLLRFGTALIVTIFFGILTVALCWVLLMRAFKLWIYIMFSPLFGLAYFTGEGWSGPLQSEGGGSSGQGSGLSKVSFKGFFQLAMVPVLVSGVLAFGLLFIGVIRQSFVLTNTDTNSGGIMCNVGTGFMVQYCIQPNSQETENGGQGYDSWLIIGNDETNKDAKGAGEYTITFEFGDMFSGFIGDAETSSGIVSGGDGLVDSVESVFAHIIITLIALVIIWMGVKAAVNYDEVTRIAFEPFARLGDSVQHAVAHLPSHLPMPHPGFKALTPTGMAAMADGLRNAVDQSAFEEQKRIKEFFSSPGAREFSAAAQTFRGSAQDFGRFVDKLPTALDSPNGIKDVKGMFKKMSENSGEFSKEQRQLFTDLSQQNDKAGMAQVLNADTNKTVIASLERQSGNFTAAFNKIRGASTTNNTTTVFNNVTVKANGEISGGGMGGGLNVSKKQELISKINETVSPEKLRSIPQSTRDKLKTGTSAEKKTILKDLGITVEGDANVQPTADAVFEASQPGH